MARLHSLKIRTHEYLRSNGLLALAAFSNHPHLGHLTLDVRPHSLLNDITKVPGLIAAHTPSQISPPKSCTLYFVTVGGPDWEEIPSATRAQKRQLTEYLLLAFPGLKLESQSRVRYYTYEDPDGKILAELQEILLELRKEREKTDNLVV